MTFIDYWTEYKSGKDFNNREAINIAFDAWCACINSDQVQAVVKPACGNCINCIHFVDIDIQKDLQSACTHKNITVEWVENPEEFGCIYFESKSV